MEKSITTQLFSEAEAIVSCVVCLFSIRLSGDCRRQLKHSRGLRGGTQLDILFMVDSGLLTL